MATGVGDNAPQFVPTAWLLGSRVDLVTIVGLFVGYILLNLFFVGHSPGEGCG